jgi:hypothetical protein
MKIGIIGGQLGETTSMYPYKLWMNFIDEKYIHDGHILNEPALVAALEYKYADCEAVYISQMNEKLLQKNDINFLDGVNLLNAWHNSKEQYKKWLKIMKNPKNNIYPTLKEQFFLYNKGDYLKYYESKGIPIAPTFLIKSNRNPKYIIEKVKQNGWCSFVIKPDYAYANIEIAKFDLEDNDLELNLMKYLKKTKKFPGFTCQQKMKGFINHWEVKSFWINGEYKYNIAIKAWPPPESIGSINASVLKQIKKLGKKVYDNYPKTFINGKHIKPLFLRIDFGCCQGNTNDTSKYFLNEIEYCGCGKFTDLKNVFHYWPIAYYNKAKEITKL